MAEEVSGHCGHCNLEDICLRYECSHEQINDFQCTHPCPHDTRRMAQQAPATLNKFYDELRAAKDPVFDGVSWDDVDEIYCRLKAQQQPPDALVVNHIEFAINTLDDLFDWIVPQSAAGQIIAKKIAQLRLEEGKHE